MNHLPDIKELIGQRYEFYKNGSLSESKNYVDGALHGELKSYFPAKLKAVKNYVDGKQQGKELIYFENGQL